MIIFCYTLLTMTPTQVKELEKKIDRLEKKLDFVVHHYIHVDNEEKDWIDDPRLIPMLEKRIEESKEGPLYTSEEVFNDLGI